MLSSRGEVLVNVAMCLEILHTSARYFCPLYLSNPVYKETDLTLTFDL